MSIVHESLIYRIIMTCWNWIWSAYDSSYLARLVRGISAGWKGWWHGSALVRFWIEREGTLPGIWPDSLSCKLLTALINLPANLLHWIYQHFQKAFDSSFFANLAFEAGESVPIAAGWGILLIMNIPYSHWNNAYSLAGFLLLLLLTVAGGMRRKSLRLDVVNIGPYLICFLFAVVLSWPMSLVPGLSFRYLYYHAACALCVVVVVSTVERPAQLERLAAFVCLGMAGASLYGIYQRIQGVEVNRHYVDMTINAGMPGRIDSFYDNPNSFAEMLGLLIPIGIGLFLGAKKKRYRLIGLASASLGSVALIMTYCRASWIGLAASAVVFVFLWYRKLLPALFVLAISAVPFLPSTIMTRVLSIFNKNDTSTNSRIPIYQGALRTIRMYPLLGIGLGRDVVQQTIQELGTYGSAGMFIHAHNIFLQLWLEHGLLGVVAFAASIYHCLKQGAKAALLPNCSTPVRLAVIGAVSGLAGGMVSGLADYLFTYPRVMLIFWVTVSLLLAGVKLARKEVA